METQLKTLSETKEKNMKQEREDWIQATNRLFDQITEWVAAKNWTVQRQPRTINEEKVGAYTVFDAVISAPTGELRLK